jgi:hypothetical protein
VKIWWKQTNMNAVDLLEMVGRDRYDELIKEHSSRPDMDQDMDMQPASESTTSNGTSWTLKNQEPLTWTPPPVSRGGRRSLATPTSSLRSYHQS